MVNEDELPFWAHLQAIVAQDGKTNEPVCYVILSDITDRKRAEDALTASEERYRMIFEQAGDYILVVELLPDGIPIIRDANAAALRMHGYAHAELIGKPITMLDTDESLLEERRSRLLADESATFEVQHRRKDGSVFTAEATVQTMRFGSTILAFSIERDITERKRAEAYRELGREILQILNEPEDLQDYIQRVLAALKTRTGCDAVGIRLQDGEDFPYFTQDGFSRDFLRTENTLVERGANGAACRDTDGNVSLECTCGLVLSGKTPAGHPLFTRGGSFWTNDSFPLLDLPSQQDPRLHPRNECIHQGYASVVLVAIRNKDTIVGLIQLNDRRKGCFTLNTVELLEGIASHIGEALMRKRVEAELRETNRQLEAATARANEVTVQAELATRAKSQFLAHMSHEIRTPMTAILGYAELLTERQVDHTTQAHHVAVIKRSGEQLLELINDILDLSKIEAGKLQIEPIRCSPGELVAEVVSFLQIRAAEKQVSLQTELAGPLPATVLTDPLRLRQVLINLLGNAIKFTDHGEIRLTVRLTSDGGPPRLRCDVTDTGIGMNAAQVGQLFQPFTQVDGSAVRKFVGTGLGLCISRHLAEALGGDIQVSSQPSQGSTFTLTIDPGPLDGIPMLPEGVSAVLPPPPCAVPTAAGPSTLHGRILLAEDSEDNQRLLALLLRRAGADVTAVENGQQAVAAAWTAHQAGQPFDVILMNMSMPVQNGFEATRQLRQRGYTAPIVALTAYAMAEDCQKCLAAGCNGYVIKPIDRQRLLATVASWAARGPTPNEALELS